MSRILALATALVVLLLTGCGEVNDPVASDPSTPDAPPPSSAPASEATGSVSDPPTGRRPRADYSWVEGDALGEDYAVAFVSGMTVDEVLAVLGTVERSMGGRDLQGLYAATDESIEFTEEGQVILGPPALWVDRAPGGVVVLGVNGADFYDRTDALSGRGSAAAFLTTVNADTFVHVSRRGQVVRELDTLLGDSMVGSPLPEERGLGFGVDDVGVFGATWLLLERVTGVSVTEAWVLEQAHPTYVFAEGG